MRVITPVPSTLAKLIDALTTSERFGFRAIGVKVTKRPASLISEAPEVSVIVLVSTPLTTVSVIALICRATPFSVALADAPEIWMFIPTIRPVLAQLVPVRTMLSLAAPPSTKFTRTLVTGLPAR